MHRKLAGFVLSCVVAAFVAESANAQLYSVSRDDDLIREIDPDTGDTIGSVVIDLPGFNVSGGTGLAYDSNSGMMYAMLKVGGQARELVRVDPITGEATSVGNTGDSFAGITFSSDGTLYGVTGDGAQTPESLFTLDLDDGTASFFMSLGNGDDGESIAWNPTDDHIYHASGLGNEIFEKINPDDMSITDVGTSGEYDEALAMVWDGSRDAFLLSDLNETLYTIDALGNTDFIGTLDHSAKGLAIVPAPASFALLVLGFGIRRRRR